LASKYAAIVATSCGLEVPISDHRLGIRGARIDDDGLLMPVVELRPAQLHLDALGLELLLDDDLLGVALRGIRLAHELAGDRDSDRHSAGHGALETFDERSEVAVDAVDRDVHR
jgi:hypothetical protein